MVVQMHYVLISCCCVLAVLTFVSLVLDPIEAITTIHDDDSCLDDNTTGSVAMDWTDLVNSTSVEDSSVNLTEVPYHVVVVQSLTQLKDFGNYSYDYTRRNESIVSDAVSLINVPFEVLQGTGWCSAHDASRDFIDILSGYQQKYTSRDVSYLWRWNAIVVSDCEEACQLMGQIGPSIPSETGGGVAVISDGCPSPEFTDPHRFSTFASVGGILTYLADPMVDLFVHFKVTRVVIVSSMDAAMQQTRSVFSSAFKRYNIETFEFDVDTFAVSRNDASPQTMEAFNATAISVELYARYIVLLLRPHHVIRLLQALRNEFGRQMDGDYIFFTLEHRIVTANEFPGIHGDDLASLQEGLVTASRKPFPRKEIKQSIQKKSIRSTDDDNDDDDDDDDDDDNDNNHADNDNDENSQLGYVIDAQLVLYSALQYTQPTVTNAAIVAQLRSGQMQVHGVTGEIHLNEQGARRPDYIFLIVQEGRLMPLWTVNRQGGDGSGGPNVTWINPAEKVRWPGDQFPPDPYPDCVWDKKCDSTQLFSLDTNSVGFRNLIILIVCLSTAVLLLFGFWLFRKVSHVMAVRTALQSVIKWPELTFYNKEKEDKEDKDEEGSLRSDSMKSHHNATNAQMLSAIYQHVEVAVKVLIGCPSIDLNRNDVLDDIRKMRAVKHENIVEFIGICIEAPNVAIVMFHTQRGSLQDVILTCDRRILSLDFVASLLIDVCKGMEYLHTTEIGSHGHLSSTKCLVDMRWTCRVSGYGMGHFRQCESKLHQPEDTADDDVYRDMMYIAPEILRVGRRHRPLYGSKEGDVFSFAIILQESVLVSQPYAIDLHRFTGKEIISQVRAKNAENPFRPSLGNECSPGWTQLIKDCWAESPETRLTFHEILARLEKLSRDFNLGFIEKLMLKLEQHAINLQEMVKQATDGIVSEKSKVDGLLYSLLPKIIADDLKQGKMTKPEKFKSATVYFSDIVGFTKIAAISTPMQIVHVLNSLYQKYDAVTDRHDAYKVETIGDSYMVVSGLPIRNGQRHAVEIARLAVESLAVLSDYKMEHLPGTPVKARIGIHTGTTLAGVVGLKMPRYCLFGETVQIAAKMESSGEANKIHISSATAELLAGTKGFVLESRGEREIIRDVTIKTYYLRRNSKDEVFAWMKGKVLPTMNNTLSSTSPTNELLSPYMVQQPTPPPAVTGPRRASEGVTGPPRASEGATGPPRASEGATGSPRASEGEGGLKGHNGQLTKNGIVYVFSNRDSK